jgi:hypothetical protein
MKRDLRSELDMGRWTKYCGPELNHQIVKGLELLTQQLHLARDLLINSPCSGLLEVGVRKWPPLLSHRPKPASLESEGYKWLLPQALALQSACSRAIATPSTSSPAPQPSIFLPIWCGLAVACQIDPLGAYYPSSRLQPVQLLQLVNNTNQAESAAKTSR